MVPVLLALGMLAVVLAAALGPATGTVAASSACQYGTCPSNGPSALTWGLGALLAAVILIVALAIILQRRRGGPPSSGAGGVAAWQGTPPESPAPAEAAPYMETPDDVGAATGTAVAGGAAAGGSAGAAEPGDIDSLMGELDRISGEILKRGPGKKGPPTGGSDAEEAASDN